MPFKLFTSPMSANGRKALALTYHLKLSAEINLTNVYKGEGQTPEYLAINPFGKIPALVEGDFKLTESNAILQYIAEAHGDNQLYSQDPKIKAEISSWLFWESAHWQPAITSVLAEVVGHALVPEHVPTPTQAPNWDDKDFNECVNKLNSHLKEHSFLVNNQLTIADFSVAGMMTYFRYSEFRFKDFPHLQKWFKQIEALVAWKRTESAPFK